MKFHLQWPITIMTSMMFIVHIKLSAKTAVTLLLTHWSYCSLALSHQYKPTSWKIHQIVSKNQWTIITHSRMKTLIYYSVMKLSHLNYDLKHKNPDILYKKSQTHKKSEVLCIQFQTKILQCIVHVCVCVKTEVNVWEVLTQKYISGFHGIKGYVSKNVLFHIKTNNPSANEVYSGKKCIPIKNVCSLFCFVLFCFVVVISTILVRFE